MSTWIFSLIKEHRLSCYIRHNIRTVYRIQSFNNSFFLVGGGGGGGGLFNISNQGLGETFGQ